MHWTPAIQPPSEPCTNEPQTDPNEVMVSINDTLDPDEILDPPSDKLIALSDALTRIRSGVDVNPLIGLYDQQTPFRLISTLRDAAQTKNPEQILAQAAASFYRAQNPTKRSSPKEDLRLGSALADLAVTGRMAYTNFQSQPPAEESLREPTRALVRDLAPKQTPEAVDNAIASALDRAYAVAWALRGPVALRPKLRKDLGWIAVSSDDDRPHRPVNLPSPPFEQFDITVSTQVPGPPSHTLSVRTRFFIASAVEDAAPATKPAARELPPDPVPHIPAGHQVLLFIHGHSSSAEEALAIIPHILQAGLDRGRKYSIISLDLPNNGYSESFKHESIADRFGTSWPSSPTDGRPISAPILDYLEDFVVAFIDALDAITPVKNRFAGAFGGSLGGNLGLRLGQRDHTRSRWLEAGIVSWSAASVWKPTVNSFFNSIAPGKTWGNSVLLENTGSRRDYFHEVYNAAAIPTASPRTQPQMWYRDGWEPCKTQRIQESWMARQEIYDENFRQMHWRVACEQLIFSHQDHIAHNPTRPFRYEMNRNVPVLLVSGEMDNFVGTFIFDYTQDLSRNMVYTPGRSLFLKETGHSVHVERPHFLANQIVDFLFTTLGGLTFCDDEKKAISVWNPLALGLRGFALLENTPCRLYDLQVMNKFDHRVEIIAARITSSADSAAGPVFTVKSKLPFSIGPGQSDWLEIDYNGAGKGPVTGFVEVECDDSSNPISRIPLSSIVVAVQRPELRITPNPIDLGARLVGSTVWADITLENVGDGESQFMQVEVSPAGPFSVKPNFPALVLPGGVASKSSAVIRVLYEPRARGASAATLVIEERSQDPSYARRHEIPLSARATMPTLFLVAGPQRWARGLFGQPDVPIRDVELRLLDFGLVAPNRTSAASFWIRNVGDAPLTVNGVLENLRNTFGVTDHTIFPAVLQPGQEMEVLCSFLAPPVPGKSVSSTFRVLSDDPARADGGDPLLSGALLEVQGRSGGPNLIEPIEFDQGIVVAKQSEPITFIWRSDGTDSVMVREATLIDLNPGINFSLSSVPQIPATLDPGTELALTVTLTAPQPGVYEADLVVTHNGNPSLNSRVRLRGIVV